MMVLVFVGTLAQKDSGLFAVQNKYFSSWILWISYLPTPGGRMTMLIMFINLLFFVFTKTLWKKSKLGILIVHLGGILLMVGGGLTAMFSSEGNIVIAEGEKSNFIEDYHFMELAIVTTNNPNYDSFTIFDYPLLKVGNILKHNSLPFEIEVLGSLENCEPVRREKPAGMQYRGMLKSFILSDLVPSKEEHLNRPGIIFHISNSGTFYDGIYGLYLGQGVPQVITVNGVEYTIIFRKMRTYLPFEIELIDFKKVLHPGTGVAKSYSSDVNVIDSGISKFIKIEMNQPLRYKGYTFYQSSFIESSEGEMTVLAAVKNYGRLFPYISSIVMCFGLMVHLVLRLPNLFNKTV
tara:strand:- start:1176 stop:2222 length:1047 start_codon:yes stop_codon:yes gene_type:complete